MPGGPLPFINEVITLYIYIWPYKWVTGVIAPLNGVNNLTHNWKGAQVVGE